MDMNMLSQAKAQMEDLQKELESQEYEGVAGGGLVKVIISGSVNIKKITIDPSLLNKDEADMLTDLIAAAFNDAKTKMTDDSNTRMSAIMGKLKNFKLPF